MRLPISLAGSRRITHANRNLGDRPRVVLPVSPETERILALSLIKDLNKDLNLGLSLDLAMFRQAEDLEKVFDAADGGNVLVVGASNARRLADALAENGVTCVSTAMPGWRLTSANANAMAERVGTMGEEDIVVLYCLDSSIFVEIDEDLNSRLPRKGKDGRYHLSRKLTVVSGLQLERVLDNLKTMLLSCGQRQYSWRESWTI